MVWGTFTLTHIITLIVGILIIVGLYFLLRNKNPKIQQITLFVLSLSGIAAIIFNLIKWGSPLEYLPLHMCSINAMILPIAILTKNKYICNLLLVWCVGAGLALVVNMDTAHCEIFSVIFNFYYFPHLLEFGIPILLFALKLSELDFKCIPITLLITFLIYTSIHFINVAINNYTEVNNILDWKGEVIQVNYMFSITPSNPILKIMYKIIPYSYWYMLPTILLFGFYIAIIYGCNNLYKKHRTKSI